MALAMEKNYKQVWFDKNLGGFMAMCENCGKLGTTVKIYKEYVVKFRGHKFQRSVVGFRCMECREVFIDPECDKKLEADYQKFVVDICAKTKNQTCVSCKDNMKCKFAWDLYNTNGDCLAAK